jgi:rhomboid family GlyGly-CTERM serine protease
VSGTGQSRPIGNWRTALAVVAVLASLTLAGPRVVGWLRYERAAVLSGQLWRLFTSHLVHADVAHLAWNLAGAALVAWLFGREYTRLGWCLILLASTIAIDAGFLLLDPGLEWYVGLSGVLHGCMAAGVLAWLRRSRDPVAWLLLVALVAKLGWESVRGALPFTATTLSVPVVHEAHLYGAVGGAVAALWLLRRRPGRVAPL